MYPLYKPALIQTTGERLPHFAFGANGYNVLQSQYQFQTLIIAWESKEQVKTVDEFIADIQHDTEYFRHIKDVFDRHPEDNASV